MVHIVPIDDWITHDSSTVCICEPKLEASNGEMLIIHIAIDDRKDGDGRKWGVFK